MAFSGFLIKSVKNNRLFPHKYIKLESYASKPNSREEIEAYRDDNTRNLTRVTASGKKSSIRFSVMDGLHLAEKSEILKFFTDAEELETNKAEAHLQRKVLLQYWNDEEETYKTGYFYRTDIDFTIRSIEGNDIIYNGFDVELVEY